MTEQTILLILLFCALAATLGLYILKAAKQTAYRGDERWQTVQLKAGVLADATNWLLIFLLLGAAIFADGEATFTLTAGRGHLRRRRGHLHPQPDRHAVYDLFWLPQSGGAGRRPLLRPSAVRRKTPRPGKGAG